MPSIDFRRAPNESPDVIVERAELFLDFKETFRIVDSCRDFEAVTYDTRILEDLFDPRQREPRYFHRVEVRERFAIAFPLSKNS